MGPDGNSIARDAAVDRAKAHSPFLRDAMQALPQLADAFLGDGSEAAVRLALKAADADLGTELRQQRVGLALGVALGDLAGEMSL